jgi:hypothetical protein
MPTGTGERAKTRSSNYTGSGGGHPGMLPKSFACLFCIPATKHFSSFIAFHLTSIFYPESCNQIHRQTD